MAKERVDAGRGRGKGVVTPPKKGGGNKTFFILLAALLVVGIGTLSWLATRGGNVTQLDPNVAPVANQGHVIGSATAPVEVVEFADFECPACGSFANLTEPDVRARLVNTGQVRFRFVDYPLDIHPNTWAAHSAAWCASEQNRFWEMHDLIFQNQDRWASQATRRPNSVLTPLAQQLGLDMNRYEGCIDGRKFHPQIKANYDEAIKRGIPSTPTFIIGTQQVNGAVSYDQFKRYVDQALAAAPRARADTGTGVKLTTPAERARPR
jgi:protein-disulfide isomerase